MVKMRRVLPVGLRAGAGRQGTVHTRVSSTADGSYHLCLGEISSSWHHFRAGKEGRTGGADLLGSGAQGNSSRVVCLLPVHASGGQTVKAEEPFKLMAQE